MTTKDTLLPFKHGHASHVKVCPDIIQTQGRARFFLGEVLMNHSLNLSIVPAFSLAIASARRSTVSRRYVLQENKSIRYNRFLQAPRRRRSNTTTVTKAESRLSPLLLSMNFTFGTQGKGIKENTALLLVDHGSKRTKANAMLEEVAQELQNRTSIPVYFAHMELASPTIAEGMQLCVQNGAKHVIIVPFFLSPGRHVTSDIPQLTAEAAQNFPHVSYEVKPPIGAHPGIIELILDCAGVLSS
ncbi:Cobalamin biosynthesis CbiX [Gracilaria domingensis]|nr:Cobalamin biosynthesis CbiX [Gracilaria domingensis]